MCSKDHKVLVGSVIQGRIEEINCVHGSRLDGKNAIRM